jgi:hypothetical protein
MTPLGELPRLKYIRDRLEVIKGDLYWKRCELYRWAVGKIRAGKHTDKGRVVIIDGETHFVRDIINLLEEVK